MAQKHKRAFEVEVAPLAERSGFQELAHRYWKVLAAVTVLIAAVVVLIQIRGHQASTTMAQSWDRFRQEIDLSTLQAPGASAEVARAADELAGTPAGIWALAMEVMAFTRDREFDRANAALSRLRGIGGTHALVADRIRWGSEPVEMTLPEFLGRHIEDAQAFEAKYPGLFHNPTLPAGAPRVRINTAKGEVVVGLFADRASQHVENFLELVDNGFYDGTVFHRVVPGSLIQGGDPNSKNDDVSTWGQGGPGYEVPAEDSGLYHFAGVLAAAKLQGADGSSGSQFYITVAPSHQFDGDYTVFGAVLEGQEVVDSIAGGTLVKNTQRPESPVVLESAVRL